jgi:hypothetical protein
MAADFPLPEPEDLMENLFFEDTAQAADEQSQNGNEELLEGNDAMANQKPRKPVSDFKLDTPALSRGREAIWFQPGQAAKRGQAGGQRERLDRAAVGTPCHPLQGQTSPSITNSV